MANATKSALKAMLPNSGHRPPNLTVTASEHRACATCEHWNGSDRCKLFDYSTRPNQVCDDWAPQPT